MPTRRAGMSRTGPWGNVPVRATGRGDEGKAEVTGGKDTAHGAAAERPGWARELLEHLRPAGRDVRRVVDWLAGAVRAEAALRDGAGGLLAGTPLPLDEALAADVASGRIASAAWDGDGRHLRMVRIRHPTGACVLAVSRGTPFDRHASDVVTHTAQVLELLLTAHETQAAGRPAPAGHRRPAAGDPPAADGRGHRLRAPGRRRTLAGTAGRRDRLRLRPGVRPLRTRPAGGRVHRTHPGGGAGGAARPSTAM